MYRFFRTVFGRKLIAWIFSHMSFAIPVKRLLDTDFWIAFYHPQPSYAVHILLVPKKEIVSLEMLNPDDQELLSDLFRCVQSLIEKLGLQDSGYRLIANGGKYQEIPQLHFHLVADMEKR